MFVKNREKKNNNREADKITVLNSLCSKLEGLKAKKSGAQQVLALQCSWLAQREKQRGEVSYIREKSSRARFACSLEPML